MQTLVIIGSPRKKGNTEILTSSVLQGLKKGRGEHEIIRLNTLSIKPCIGCGNCEKTGHCILRDDMQDLYLKIDSADCIIIASPIYFYGVTAQTKLFIDRTQALWSRKYILEKVQPGKKDNRPNRYGFFLSISATNGQHIFDGAVLTVRYCFDAMNIHFGGKFMVPGMDHLGVISEDKETLRQAERFGNDITKMMHN